jgi:hypothetical protein
MDVRKRKSAGESLRAIGRSYGVSANTIRRVQPGKLGNAAMKRLMGRTCPASLLYIEGAGKVRLWPKCEVV